MCSGRKPPPGPPAHGPCQLLLCCRPVSRPPVRGPPAGPPPPHGPRGQGSNLACWRRPLPSFLPSCTPNTRNSQRPSENCSPGEVLGGRQLLLSFQEGRSPPPGTGDERAGRDSHKPICPMDQAGRGRDTPQKTAGDGLGATRGRPRSSRSPWGNKEAASAVKQRRTSELGHQMGGVRMGEVFPTCPHGSRSQVPGCPPPHCIQVQSRPSVCASAPSPRLCLAHSRRPGGRGDRWAGGEQVRPSQGVQATTVSVVPKSKGTPRPPSRPPPSPRAGRDPARAPHPGNEALKGGHTSGQGHSGSCSWTEKPEPQLPQGRAAQAHRNPQGPPCTGPRCSGGQALAKSW